MSCLGCRAANGRKEHEDAARGVNGSWASGWTSPLRRGREGPLSAHLRRRRRSGVGRLTDPTAAAQLWLRAGSSCPIPDPPAKIDEMRYRSKINVDADDTETPVATAQRL